MLSVFSPMIPIGYDEIFKKGMWLLHHVTPLVMGITRIGHACYEDKNSKTIIFDSPNNITNHAFLRGSSWLVCHFWLMDMYILIKS
jgi:hypothetical protein